MKSIPSGKIISDLGRRLTRQGIDVPALVRKVLVAWLLAVTVEYLILPPSLRDLASLEGLARMSGLRIIVMTIAAMAALLALSRIKGHGLIERWALVAVFAVLALAALVASFTWPFLGACLLVLGLLIVYAFRSWDNSAEPEAALKHSHPVWAWLAAAIALGAFAFVSIWTLARVYCLSTSTYDFGIFAQMFHNMKETGLPMTTLERDGWLSHFDVHVSPIYYLLLPLYMLVPTPGTLQVLQAAVMASAAIPLWKIGKHHGLSGLQCTLLCAVLMAYPAFCAGASYDIHENCFLTPLLLWLFYGIDRKNTAITAVAALLTLMVKEDAAVYVAVVGLWLVLRNLLRLRNADKWSMITGWALLAGALGWFFAVTSYLAGNGDGVMTYRYDNFFFDDSGSLLSVVKAVLLNPMKAVFECVDADKLKYIKQTMVVLVGLPLLTRRYERYVLLIPYLLINLMSDYGYQHHIFFQYNFGSVAFLMYLSVVNLSELKRDVLRTGALALAVLLGLVCIYRTVYPIASVPVKRAIQNPSYYADVHEALATIPEDASVAATGFYTVPLSQRRTVYDISYCSEEHLLESEYVALQVDLADNYRHYATASGEDGFEQLVEFLEKNGYELYHELDGVLVIYKKQ